MEMPALGRRILVRNAGFSRVDEISRDIRELLSNENDEAPIPFTSRKGRKASLLIASLKNWATALVDKRINTVTKPITYFLKEVTHLLLLLLLLDDLLEDSEDDDLPDELDREDELLELLLPDELRTDDERSELRRLDELRTDDERLELFLDGLR